MKFSYFSIIIFIIFIPKIYASIFKCKCGIKCNSNKFKDILTYQFGYYWFNLKNLKGECFLPKFYVNYFKSTWGIYFLNLRETFDFKYSLRPRRVPIPEAIKKLK